MSRVGPKNLNRAQPWWVVPFGGDGGGALVARAGGTCNRFCPFDIRIAITFDAMEVQGVRKLFAPSSEPLHS